MSIRILHVETDLLAAKTIAAELARRGLVACVDCATAGKRPDHPLSDDFFLILVGHAALDDPALLDRLDEITSPLCFVLNDRLEVPLGVRGTVFDLRLQKLSPKETRLRFDALCRIALGDAKPEGPYWFHSGSILSERTRRAIVEAEAQKPIATGIMIVAGVLTPLAAYLGVQNLNFIGQADQITSYYAGGFLMALFLEVIPLSAVLLTEGEWAFGGIVQIYRTFSAQNYAKGLCLRLASSALITTILAPVLAQSIMEDDKTQIALAEKAGHLTYVLLVGLLVFFSVLCTLGFGLWLYRLPQRIARLMFRRRVFSFRLSESVIISNIQQ